MDKFKEIPKKMLSLVYKQAPVLIAGFVAWLTFLLLTRGQNTDGYSTLFWVFLALTALTNIVSILYGRQIISELIQMLYLDLEISPDEKGDEISTLRSREMLFYVLDNTVIGVAWILWIAFKINFFLVLPLFFASYLLHKKQRAYQKLVIGRIFDKSKDLQ